MKYARFVNIGCGLVVSSALLVGCGGRDAPSEPPVVESDAAPSDAVEAPTEAESPSTNEENTAAVDDTTAINPPQSATLTAQQADSQINLRSQPTTASESAGYGLVGDAVQLLKATEGEGALTWYYVKFNESGAEGWIRGDFIDTDNRTVSLNQGANVSIDSFTTDEVFAVGSGGCGMTLWPVGSPGEFIFFNGLPDTGMWMKLDGSMTQFRRTAASGPEFYGQNASQSFASTDGEIAVDVTANVGSEEGYESVNIEQGTLRLEGPTGGVTEMAVEGDAGC